MLLGDLPESLAPVAALLWHGDIPGVMGMCQGHHPPGFFSPIQALSIERRPWDRLGQWRCAGDTISPACAPPSRLSALAGVVGTSLGGREVLRICPIWALSIELGLWG